jgi:hypothetical protein
MYIAYDVEGKQLNNHEEYENAHLEADGGFVVELKEQWRPIKDGQKEVTLLTLEGSAALKVVGYEEPAIVFRSSADERDNSASYSIPEAVVLAKLLIAKITEAKELKDKWRE